HGAIDPTPDEEPVLDLIMGVADVSYGRDQGAIHLAERVRKFSKCLIVLTVMGSAQVSTLSRQFQRQAEQNRHLRKRALGAEDTDLGTSPLQHDLVYFTRYGGAWRIDDGGGRTPPGFGIA